MGLFRIFKKIIDTKFKFSLFLIFHIILNVIVCFYASAFRSVVIFSAVWSTGYLLAIRRFLTNPIDDFAAKHISYAPLNMYWVNLAKGLVKNNGRFLFISSIHLFMAIILIFVCKNILNKSFIILVVFISNAILPITYLYVLKKLYLLWMQENIAKRVKEEAGLES